MAIDNIPEKWVMVSGGFDPVHIGHLRMFDEAKKLGTKLLVVLNSDEWLMRKKGKSFMPEQERAELIAGFRSVDKVVVLHSDKADVCDAILTYNPQVFANGGDRKLDNTPEESLCKELGIETVYGVGGGKIQSSSWMHEKYHGK